MSDNKSIRNSISKTTLNDYEYLDNFKVGYFENVNWIDGLIEGVNFCMKQTFSDSKLNENRFLNCFKLRTTMMERANRLNLFD